MNKNKLKVGIINLIIGFIFIVLTIKFPDASMFFGFAGAMIGSGAMLIFNYFYWGNPSRQNEYSEKIENQKIDINDERKEMIRGKTARISIMVNWIFLTIAIVIVGLLGDFNVISYYRPIIIGIALYWIITTIIMMVIYKKLLKKY